MSKTQKNSRSTDELLADFLQLTISTNLNWMPILHANGSENQLVAHTQQQILSIYYYALFDWLVEYQKWRSSVDEKSFAHGSPQRNAIDLCDLHEMTAMELCDIFSTEEHMVMTYLRHYLAHGYVTAFSDRALQTFEISNGKVIKGSSKPADTNSSREQTTSIYGGLEQTLQTFYQRFAEFPTRHWPAVRHVFQPAPVEDIERCIITGSTNYSQQAIDAITIGDGLLRGHIRQKWSVNDKNGSKATKSQ